jgi:hypothetical protein
MVEEATGEEVTDENDARTTVKSIKGVCDELHNEQ